MSKWVRTLLLVPTRRNATLSIWGDGAARKCIVNCFDCFANHREPLLHMAKIFTKGTRGQVRSRTGASEVRLGGLGVRGRAGERFAKQPVSRYQDTKYVQYLPPCLACLQAGQAGRLVEFFICLARAAPSTRLECAHGCNGVPLWYGRANQDAIKISSRLLVGPESKLQWLWPQLHRRFCGFLSQHGAN